MASTDDNMLASDSATFVEDDGKSHMATRANLDTRR
jgi:hypothetical protein